MDPVSREQLRGGARELGAALGETEVARFEAYAGLLQLWGGKMNLTARLDSSGIVTHHFLDSLTLLPFLPTEGSTSLIDVGAGAGFPALPLKICLPALAVTLVESSHKKVSFCREVVRRLGLQGVKVVEGRAEALGGSAPWRGAYDWAVARALGPTALSIRLCVPFLRPGGRLALYKGRIDEAELRRLEDQAAAEGALLTVESVSVPFLQAARSLVFLKKCST